MPNLEISYGKYHFNGSLKDFNQRIKAALSTQFSFWGTRLITFHDPENNTDHFVSLNLIAYKVAQISHNAYADVEINREKSTLTPEDRSEGINIVNNLSLLRSYTDDELKKANLITRIIAFIREYVCHVPFSNDASDRQERRVFMLYSSRSFLAQFEGNFVKNEKGKDSHHCATEVSLVAGHEMVWANDSCIYNSYRNLRHYHRA